MYTPRHFAEPDDAVVERLVRSVGFGHLVVMIDGQIEASPVPFVADPDLTTIRAHVARANPIGHTDGLEAALIVPVTDAYVSPGWYPSKQEHGKVVPTWNYEVVNLHGSVTVHDDRAWLMRQLTDLTDRNESALATPWSVGDAPDDFIAKQLRSIIGLELAVSRVEAKRKLSQNRSTEDQAGVVAGLIDRGAEAEPMVNAMVSRSKLSRSRPDPGGDN